MSTSNDAVPTSTPAGSGADWLSIDQAAERLGTTPAAVRQMLREGDLIADRSAGRPRIPAALIHDGQTSRYLPGILTLLRDGGFSEDESVAWLVTPDDSLGGTPASAIHRQLHREVSRRAQALAF